jgi:hypothetical protein
MTSEKHLRNARESATRTCAGPRTSERKSVSRVNSLKTGPLRPIPGYRRRTPSGSQSQFPTTPIGSTKNWLRSFILPYPGPDSPGPVPPRSKARATRARTHRRTVQWKPQRPQIFGVLKAADNIRQSNAEKLTSASLNFVQRWNSPSYWQVKAEWRKLNEADTLDGQARDALLDKDISKRIVAVEILNFYEEMATGINNGSLDEILLRGYWEPVILKSFARYE